MEPKFERPINTSERDERAAEVVELADWRAARDTAPEYVAERAPDLMNSEASPEKVAGLRTLLDEFARTMKDVDATLVDKRQAYYAAEEVARILAETEHIVSEEQVLRRQERTSTPEMIPTNYPGVAMLVPADKRQYLSPANDNRPAGPGLADPRLIHAS
jgi:hypothetical protein